MENVQNESEKCKNSTPSAEVNPVAVGDGQSGSGIIPLIFDKQKQQPAGEVNPNLNVNARMNRCNHGTPPHPAAVGDGSAAAPHLNPAATASVCCWHLPPSPFSSHPQQHQHFAGPLLPVTRSHWPPPSPRPYSNHFQFYPFSSSHNQQYQPPRMFPPSPYVLNGGPAAAGPPFPPFSQRMPSWINVPPAHCQQQPNQQNPFFNYAGSPPPQFWSYLQSYNPVGPTPRPPIMGETYERMARLRRVQMLTHSDNSSIFIQVNNAPTQDLRELIICFFSRFGMINFIRIAKTKKKNKIKGAQISFFTQSAAALAIVEMDGKMWPLGGLIQCCWWSDQVAEKRMGFQFNPNEQQQSTSQQNDDDKESSRCSTSTGTTCRTIGLSDDQYELDLAHEGRLGKDAELFLPKTKRYVPPTPSYNFPRQKVPIVDEDESPVKKLAREFARNNLSRKERMQKMLNLLESDI